MATRLIGVFCALAFSRALSRCRRPRARDEDAHAQAEVLLGFRQRTLQLEGRRGLEEMCALEAQRLMGHLHYYT